MRALIVFGLALVCSASGFAASSQPRSHEAKVAFLLGMADRAGRYGRDASRTAEQAALFSDKAREVAESLGFIREESGRTLAEEEWMPKVLALLKPRAPRFDPDAWFFLADSGLPSDWDRDCLWAYLLGTYCMAGRDRFIGYFSTPRAFVVVAVMREFEPGSGAHVTTAVGYIPGGSRVELPQGEPWDRLIAEGKSLLAAAK